MKKIDLEEFNKPFTTWKCPTCSYEIKVKPEGIKCQELCPNCRHKFLGDFIKVTI